MLRRLTILLATLLATSSFANPLGSRDPVGETADYKLDRSSSRTSSMIQSGTMKAAVTQFVPDHADGPSYEVKIDYSLKILLMGTRTGSQVVMVPEEYFTPEFMQELRVNGQYSSENFKVTHLGYGDARTMDGGFYPNCDKIRIYDIATEALESGGIFSIARELLTPPGPLDDSIEDMKIVALIKEGLPVLGAAKLDVTGVYQGRNVKAGADYQRP